MGLSPSRRWYPITMEVAARKLSVNKVTLRCWMKDEDQIVAMPSGSKRADKYPRVWAETVAVRSGTE